ncbi:hypothetical protein DMUE_0667 [Dictyocoela muelleri]|nr:hypothetical protein DMUE_0667 [Dictyocoela muelleri]
MKLKTKILKTIRTPRTKSISTQTGLPTISTHYDGTFIINNFNNNNLNNNKINITNCPIRASCFYKNNILLGSDSGEITVHDITGLKIKTIKAHNDFIRCLDSNNIYFVSCSDDFTIKLFKDFKTVSVMNHDHFVMAVRIVRNMIYSVSLDCSLKVFKIEDNFINNYNDNINNFDNNTYVNNNNYNLNTNILNNNNNNNINNLNNNEISISCLTTIKDHKMGINNIEIYKNFLSTCGDDLKINIYELETLKLINSLQTDKNILSIHFCDNFMFCGSEDGSVFVYKIKSFSLEAVLKPNLGRVWVIKSQSIINHDQKYNQRYNLDQKYNLNQKYNLENNNKYNHDHDNKVLINHDDNKYNHDDNNKILNFHDDTFNHDDDFNNDKTLIILGCDEGLQTIELYRPPLLSTMIRNKIIIYHNNSLSRLSIQDNQLSIKELKVIDPEVKNISSNSKYVAVEFGGLIEIYNYVGFRHKETIEGDDICFLKKADYKYDNDKYNIDKYKYDKYKYDKYNNDSNKYNNSIDKYIDKYDIDYNKYAYLKSDTVVYKNSSLKISGIKKLFHLFKEIFAGVTEKETIIFGYDGLNFKVIEKLPVFRKIVFMKNYLFCFSQKIFVYRKDEFDEEKNVKDEKEEFNFNNNLINVYNEHADNIYLYKDLIFFTSKNHLFYFIIGKRIYLQFIGIQNNRFLGIIDDQLVFKRNFNNDNNFNNFNDFNNDLTSRNFFISKLDIEFINYQRNILNGKFPVYKIDNKVVMFLQSLGYYEKILEITDDCDLRFDILVKLKRYDEAMNVVLSNDHDCKVDQCLCLAEIYKDLGEYKKSSLMFFKAKRYDDSFLMHFCSGSFNDDKSDFDNNDDKKDDDKKDDDNKDDDINFNNYNSDVDFDEFLKNQLSGKISGILQYIVDYKKGDFEKCKEFLKNTEFYDLFVKHHYDC